MDQDRSAERGGVLLVILALAPLDKKGDVSFILDKKKVQSAPERMRVEEARYTGTDDKGQLFQMVANRAVQRSSDTPLVDINGMFARLNLEQGPLLIAADQGRYNLDTQQVAVIGPIKVAWRRRLAAADQRRECRPEAAAARQPGARPRARCASASSAPTRFGPISALIPSCSTAVLA